MELREDPSGSSVQQAEGTDVLYTFTKRNGVAVDPTTVPSETFTQIPMVVTGSSISRRLKKVEDALQA